ncbi:MAG TPA: SAF domain-containing protein [Micromonosporaceae bacterium]
MTVSTKVPTSRAGGAPSGGGGPGGPISAPRVVNNRRIRTGGILLAVLLLVLGAALSALALLSATRTSSYIAVAKQVNVGAKITADDLTTVEFSGGQGLQALEANQINNVIGQRAGVTLMPGTLVTQSELTTKNLLADGQVELGLSFAVSRLASLSIKAGDHITLVPLSASGAAAGTSTFDATVIDVGAVGSDGTVVLHVAVSTGDAPTILQISSNGGFGMFQQSTGN